MPLILSRNDITKVEVDAIVLPANEKLLPGAGTSQDIFEAAGAEELAKACSVYGHCTTGSVVVTDAFNLNAKVIIHAVVPVWRGGGHNERLLLYAAYRSALREAIAIGLKSIAFPLLSSGNYGYPKAEALSVANRAISDFLKEHDMNVHLVFYDKESVAAGRALFDEIDEYIDDKYVGRKRDAYWKNEGQSGSDATVRLDSDRDEEIRRLEKVESGKEECERIGTFSFLIPKSEDDSDTAQLKEWLFEQTTTDSSPDEPTLELSEQEVDRIRAESENPWLGSGKKEVDGYPTSEAAVKRKCRKCGEDLDRFSMFCPTCGCPVELDKKQHPLPNASRKPGATFSIPIPQFNGERQATANIPKREKTSLKERLNGLIKGDSETFHQMLFRLIDESGLSYPQVYNRANMSKKLFSKIKLNPDSTPKKKNVIALAVALRLDMKQTTELLMKAGYALSNSSMTDVIISYFIEKQNYDVFEINEVLFEYGLENDLLGF